MEGQRIIYPPLITVNQKVFVKQQMLAAHDHVLYVCKESFQQIRVRYSNAMDKYELEGCTPPNEFYPYKVFSYCISGWPIYMQDRYILNWFPGEGKSDIGEFIEAMKTVDEAIRETKPGHGR